MKVLGACQFKNNKVKSSLQNSHLASFGDLCDSISRNGSKAPFTSKAFFPNVSIHQIFKHVML